MSNAGRQVAFLSVVLYARAAETVSWAVLGFAVALLIVNVYVGTSSRNSHSFVQHCVTHRELSNGDREYRFYVDGKCLKRSILKKGASNLKKLGTREVNTIRS